MNDKQITNEKVRPTKKQRELLTYIENFISEHGYSPSYREIMSGLGYTSVATVALHVNSLLSRGHLRKRDHSARSLEVTSSTGTKDITTNYVAPGEEKWLIDKVEHAFSQAESSGANLKQSNLENLNILVEGLKILGIEGGAQSFIPRLQALKQQNSSKE